MVVIGGGIAGLVVAYDVLRRRPHARVVVLEPGASAGGRIGRAQVAGVSIDTGPDAFLARVPGAVELAHDLGLGGDLVAPATGAAAVWSRGVVRPLPGGLILGVPSRLGPVLRSGIISRRGLARMALDEVLPRRCVAGDRSVSAAIGSHLGAEVVERLVDPLLGGISAAHSDQLSVDAAAPVLATAARQPRLMRALRRQQATTAARGQIGVTEDRPVFLAPRAGVSEMVDRLVAALPNDVLQCGVGAMSLSRHLAGGWIVTGTDGVERRAMAVVLATPAPVAATLVRAFSPGAGIDLEGIRYASVALTVLAYDRSSITLPPGSGLLVPRAEGRLMTAASWWDHKWPHLVSEGNVLVRASAGRIDDNRFLAMTDAELVQALHHELSQVAPIRAMPVDSHVARWANSFPQYDVGHNERVDRIEAALEHDAPGVVLAGAAYRGSGIPATIRSALAASARVLR